MDYKINIDHELLKIGDMKNPILHNDYFYVLLDISEDNADSCRNIWKIDKSGKIAWKVKFEGSDGFSGFGIEEGKLIAYTISGGSFFIDFETGEVKFRKMTW